MVVWELGRMWIIFEMILIGGCGLEVDVGGIGVGSLWWGVGWKMYGDWEFGVGEGVGCRGIIWVNGVGGGGIGGRSYGEM